MIDCSAGFPWNPGANACNPCPFWTDYYFLFIICMYLCLCVGLCMGLYTWVQIPVGSKKKYFIYINNLKLQAWATQYEWVAKTNASFRREAVCALNHYIISPASCYYFKIFFHVCETVCVWSYAYVLHRSHSQYEVSSSIDVHIKFWRQDLWPDLELTHLAGLAS